MIPLPVFCFGWIFGSQLEILKGNSWSLLSMWQLGLIPHIPSGLKIK